MSLCPLLGSDNPKAVNINNPKGLEPPALHTEPAWEKAQDKKVEVILKYLKNRARQGGFITCSSWGCPSRGVAGRNSNSPSESKYPVPGSVFGLLWGCLGVQGVLHCWTGARRGGKGNFWAQLTSHCSRVTALGTRTQAGSDLSVSPGLCQHRRDTGAVTVGTHGGTSGLC